MKRILIGILAASMLVTASACRNKRDSAEEHAKKLASGEIEPDAKVADKTDTEDEEESESDKIVPEVDTDSYSSIIDALDDDYKSLELLPVESADFFLGKQLRLVSYLEDHQMIFTYDADIRASFDNDTLRMDYTNSDNEPVTITNTVYSISDPISTPGGNSYVYVTFGNHELTEENSEFSTDCIMLIKVADTVDMGDGTADIYVMLIESAMTNRCEIFKVEE